MVQPTRVERRSPDRRGFTLQLLRRIAVLALVLAALLWVVPRVLVARGVLGPGPEDAVRTASEAVQAARAYGATERTPELQQARSELESARAHLAAGRSRDARDAAERATAQAIAAQRRALIAHAGAQDRAKAVYDDLDRQIIDLEKLYSAATAGLGTAETSRLLSVMKATRAAAGAVFLAYEEQDFERALAAEPRARAALTDARDQLESARKR